MAIAVSQISVGAANAVSFTRPVSVEEVFFGFINKIVSSQFQEHPLRHNGITVLGAFTLHYFDTHKEGNTLGSHLAFYPAASKCFTQVKQISHKHIFCKIHRVYIRIIHKNKTEFCQIIANGEGAVMTDRQILISFFQSRNGLCA